MLRRDPKLFGIPGTRWTLAKIHDVVDWLRTTTPAGICQLLERLRISYKRGRDYVHSPDPDYLAKLAEIAVYVGQSHTSKGQIVTLYQDELTYYRQPSLARAYEERGAAQALAQRSYRSNRETRIVATLDPRDGRVLYLQDDRIGVAELIAFYQDVRTAYPQARRIEIIVDNWPVHFHPDVLIALEPQETTWPTHFPPSWSTEPSARARKKWGDLALPIQLRPLPTYASWTNPIEKLWRKLKQDELHLHRLADRLDELRQRVCSFLDQFAKGSLDLLHYVGLPVPT